MKVTIETEDKVVTIEGDEKEVIEEVKRQLKINEDWIKELLKKNEKIDPYQPVYPDVYPWVIQYCGYHDFIEEASGKRCRKCGHWEPYIDYTPWITWCSNNNVKVDVGLFYELNQMGDFDAE